MVDRTQSPPSRRALRRLVSVVCVLDTELDALCIDHFPEVFQRFTLNMDRTSKVNLLLQLAKPRALMRGLTDFKKDLVAQHQQILDDDDRIERYRSRQATELEKLLEDRRLRLRNKELTTEIDKEIRKTKKKIRIGPNLDDSIVLSNRYRLQQSLGYGGFGFVWLVYDLEQGELAAAKILRPELHHGRERRFGPRRRFERGAERMNRLAHEHIVRVIERPVLDRYSGYVYYVMEYLSGGDLGQAVCAGLIKKEAALRAILQAGSALSAAHKQGMIHRDVKPSNILLSSDGIAKLTDFDLVQVQDPDTSGGTHTGALGTFIYAAPEALANAKNVTPRADIFSLGMTTLFVLHGRNLPTDILRWLPAFIDDLEISDALKEILKRAVAWDPAERYESVAEFCAALKQMLDAEEKAQSKEDPKGLAAPPVATPRSSPFAEMLVRHAEGQKGYSAAQTLLEAALIYRKNAGLVAAMHCFERALGELTDLPETPSRAYLGAEIEYQCGIFCEEELGRIEDAMVHYQRAFKLRPENLEPLRRGRLLYKSLGDLDMVARLLELHISNLPAADKRQGIGLAVELGQLRFRLHDPTSAVEALRSALRLSNDLAATEEIPESLLSTLADAYVSPVYQPGLSEKEQARRRASEIYLDLAKRYLDGERGKDERQAIVFLRKSLEADYRNVTSAELLETIYLRLPAAQRTVELIKFYRSDARVGLRGPKLLKVYQEAGGHIDHRAVIDACRAGLDSVNSVDEWRQTRDLLKEMLSRSNDLQGLAALREEDAAEAALPDERAELLMQAADLFQRGGDQERYIVCLKQAFNELPMHTEAFRKLSDFYKSRRDFIGLAVVQEHRIAAQFEAAHLDLPTYAKQLEDLGELYEKKLHDVVSAAAIWRRIDELLPGERSQSERKRLGIKLQRIDQQIAELQIELERTPEEDVKQRVGLLRHLGQLYRELHEPKHAAGVYELLLQLSANDLPAMKILLALREQSGDVPGQLELLRQQVNLCGDRAERLTLLRRMMALCDQRTLQREGAVTETDDLVMTAWVCRALLTELPMDRDALRRLPEALILLGDKRELLDVLEASLKIAPTPREKRRLHRQIAKHAEETKDLPRAASHLEWALRILPPGTESDEVMSELARIYGLQGRTELAVQTLETCLKQSPRVNVELIRQIGRLTLLSENHERSVRAFRDVLARVPDDLESLTGLQKLYRRRSEWNQLREVLEQLLRVPESALSPRERLTVALELSEVYSERLRDLKQAAVAVERVQAEISIVDLRVHRRLRALYEAIGDIDRAARYAEKELLLTNDQVARMQRGLEIATLWRVGAKDSARALLAYERVLQIASELSKEQPKSADVRKLLRQTLEEMKQLLSDEERWPEVVLVGQRRLGLAVDQEDMAETVNILVELAQIYEDKLKQPEDARALRQQAAELAPSSNNARASKAALHGAGKSEGAKIPALALRPRL